MTRTGKLIVALIVLLAALGFWKVVHGQAVAAKRYWSGSYDPKPGRPASRVKTYELRWGTDSLTFTTNPATGTLANYIGTPADSGKADSMIVAGLPSDSRVYFAIRALDSAGNAAAWSNIFAETQPDRTPPAITNSLH